MTMDIPDAASLAVQFCSYTVLVRSTIGLLNDMLLVFSY